MSVVCYYDVNSVRMLLHVYVFIMWLLCGLCYIIACILCECGDGITIVVWYDMTRIARVICCYYVSIAWVLC